MKGTTWGVMIGGFICALFLAFNGGHDSDRAGWVYDCPSPVTMFTSSGFIDIRVNVSSGPDQDPAIGTGEPDGRRVYYKCRQAAGTRMLLAAAISIATLVVAFVVQMRRDDTTEAYPDTPDTSMHHDGLNVAAPQSTYEVDRGASAWGFQTSEPQRAAGEPRTVRCPRCSRMSRTGAVTFRCECGALLKPKS